MTKTARQRIPVFLITGFLGSGKTSFLNRMLKEPLLANSLVVINELGEIGIDHLLVATPAEHLVLLDNGCLCCALQGDLAQTFADVYAKRATGAIPAFDRVIVETTGLADPVPVIQTIVTDPAIALAYSLRSVITVVDAVHADAQFENHIESVKQVAAADLLLISKTDLVPDLDVSELTLSLKSMNPDAESMTVTQLSASGMLLGRRSQAPLLADDENHAARINRNSLVASSAQHRSLHEGDKWFRTDLHTHHASDVQTFGVYRDGSIRAAALALWMNMLAGMRGRDLLRVKGLLNVEGAPVVIHLVQTIIHEPVTLDAWPTEDHRSRIVFIGRNIDRTDIERTLEVLTFVEPPREPGLAIDPEAYADFVRVARAFAR